MPIVGEIFASEAEAKIRVQDLGVSPNIVSGGWYQLGHPCKVSEQLEAVDCLQCGSVALYSKYLRR